MFTVPNAPRISSTPDWAEQQQRERAQQQGSAERSRSVHQNLVNAGRESVTEYGRLLFKECAEKVGDALEALFGRVLRGEAPAARHYCAIPVLLCFADRGMRPVAALSLGVVLDQLSRRRTYREVALRIGTEIEHEARAIGINDTDKDLLRLLKKRATKRNEVVGLKTMERLHLGREAWSTSDRLEVGGLLLDLVVSTTGLVRVIKEGRRQEAVEPTSDALLVIKANPPRPMPARRLPMLVPPRPWTGLTGGGHLDSSEPLVSGRRGIDLDFYGRADLTAAMRVCNTLQEQEMAVDPWMVQLQREAWDGNVRGLFPVQRDPQATTPAPPEGATGKEWFQWRQQRDQAWADEAMGRKKRIRIEESIRQCESVAGRPIWFAYDVDFRGRVYTSNRYATHQGPDHEKAVMTLGQGLPCDEEGFQWLLKAAAGHYGLAKRSWDERLRWGREHIELMTAVVEDPIERLELWRGAADPWQFLQAARAVAQWLKDSAHPITCPVRFDQSCSAVGICAALLRDKTLARHTNLIGSTRHDIYAVVAERVVAMLRKEVELAGPAANRSAVLWLDLGIDRALMKPPVMTACYGASNFTLVDGLVAAIEERSGAKDLARLQFEVLRPARYLAKVIRVALREEIGACLDLQSWLRAVCQKVVEDGSPVEWLTPMGWPMHLGRELEDTVAAGTLLTGKPRMRSRHQQPTEGELSARATNRGITANLVHSFDAALVHTIVSRAADRRVQVLTNHDCFSALPCHAGWLHQQLHWELRELYKPDWLAEITAQIRRRSKVKGLPMRPRPGDLCPGQVGQNPYCFS